MSGFDLDDVPNWRGRDLIDQDGHAVGVITDLYVDDETGRPEWAAVRSALFSSRVTFVPLAQAAAHGLRVQVPYSQAHIHEAPAIDPDGHLSPEEEARLFQHYGLEYGPFVTGIGPSGADSEFIAPTTDKVDEGARQGRWPRLRRHGPAAPDPDRPGAE